MATRAGILVVALGLAAGGCLRPADGPLDALTGKVDPTDERELGYQFDQEARKHFVTIDDPVVLGFVNDLGRGFVEDLGPQPFVYHFRVIPDPTLNAFAVPGGYVYLHSGTVMAAGSVDELAGVLAHEIGHVKGRHYARMSQQAAIPNLLTALAGLAAAAATGEPGFAVAAQAANVAMQLRFSREFEAEADQLAVTFLRRSGYDPRGLVRFFDRIVAEEQADPVEIPPYLYSHPDVDDRIARVLDLASQTRATGTADPALAADLPRAQAHLSLLLRAERTTLPVTGRAPDRSKSDPLLTWAESLVREGNPEGALEVLVRAEAAEPHDPRVPFRRGEILESLDRREEAIAAFRRTVALDPTRAQVYYRIGRSYRALGDPQRAVFYLEQAAQRFAPGSDWREKADWEVVKLTFPVVTESGTADGRRGSGADTVAGATREVFGATDEEVVWWGRIAARFAGVRPKITTRWKNPRGAVVLERKVEPVSGAVVVARLPLDTPRAPGAWTVEALLEDQVIDTRTFRVQ